MLLDLQLKQQQEDIQNKVFDFDQEDTFSKSGDQEQWLYDSEYKLDDEQTKKHRLQQAQIIDNMPFYKNFLTCTICQGFQAQVQTFLTDIENLKAFRGAAGLYCQYFLGYSNETCSFATGIIIRELNAGIFQLVLSREYLCSRVVPVCTTPYYSQYLAQDYATRILQSKPTSIQSDTFINSLYSSIQGQNGRATYNILHLTDAHIDRMYVAGTKANCGNILCCRQIYGTSGEQANARGDYRCDTPSQTFNDLLSRIAAQVTPDIIFVTGGMMARDLNTTEDQVISNYSLALDQIRARFGSAQIYSAFGTDEFLPNQTQFFAFRSTRRQVQLANILTAPRTSTNATAVSEAQGYGYYSVYNLNTGSRTSTLSKVMLIVLNTQVCYTYNSGLLREQNDPAGMLSWLEGRLRAAEANQWLAFIIGQIPPGNPNCNRQYSIRYNVLMERFQHIVRLQAYGYEGTDSFKILRSTTSQKPIGIVQIGGQIGTKEFNPSARLYTMDAALHIPTKIDIYNFNLDNAIQTNTWNFNTVTYPANYGMQNLSPSEYNWLANQILISESRSKTLYNSMRKYWSQDIDCVDTCQLELYCQIYYAHNEDTMQCRDKSFDLQYGLPYVLSFLSNPWVQRT
ncbi:UNKNOWN [Stylonychia lemnae]|uniref:Sphingomyelin phosphodiesterase n=1 Tax=Stylonychia lemnae TaxID=5949 RepID=A0A078APF2_STYLE|nr:UNKNOWN [Stylonychia lemnae]|eukprot:CDW83826.1 UNKNOWN [Stylonychia lemnae]